MYRPPLPPGPLAVRKYDGTNRSMKIARGFTPVNKRSGYQDPTYVPQRSCESLYRDLSTHCAIGDEVNKVFSVEGLVRAK